MEMLGAKDLIVCPACGEETADPSLPPQELVMALAASKAREVAAQSGAGDVVIGADTVVCLDGQIFGKPGTACEAADMLRSLSGRTHEVFTGVCVIRNGRELLRYERTFVTFRSLSEEEIAAYLASGESMDKAGAYGIQGRAALFTERISGDYFNVMGLPLCLLGEMLKEQGVGLL